MIDKLRCPYKSWNSPIFEKPESAVLPPQKSTISYKQAAQFRDLAVSYFSTEQVDVNEIRLRKPSGDLADITSIADHSFEALKISSENINPNSKALEQIKPPTSTFLQCRFLACLMKCKEYDRLLRLIERIIDDFQLNITILLPLFGYIASICQGDETQELAFIQEIENIPIDVSEHKHFYHLLDELCSISYAEDLPVLLHLLIDDTDDAVISLSSTPHIFPILATNNSFIYDARLRYFIRVMDSLALTKIQIFHDLPKLIPTEEEEEND